MDAQKHQPHLKRPWLSPNDHFDTQNHHSSRAPERAREHLRAGILQGIIDPEKNRYNGESPCKKIRSSNGDEGLERHIFPRVHSRQGDPVLPERTPAHDSRRALLHPESSQNTTKTQSSSPSGSVGSNGQQQSVREASEISRGSQHKSLLITNSPGTLIGAKSNRENSQFDSFQPAVSNGKSHDLPSECNPLLQDVAFGLSKLASIMLISKIPEAEGDHHPTKDSRGEGSSSVKCPDVAQLGMKETLRWMLNVIQNTTCIAEATVQSITGNALENDRAAPTSGHRPENNSEGPLEIMKRRFLDDDIGRQHSDHAPEESRRSQELRESTSRDYMQTRDRRTTNSAAEELPPMRSQSPFSGAFSHGSFAGRTPAMNPPPAPHRPMPISPPGHQRLSPTLYNLPSPASNPTYTQKPNPINLPSPHSLSSSTLGNLLHHPISPSSSIDATAAAHAHTAALQHDVSIRTLALQSLQLEHNNLLAAFSRSQTRAVALEKKHIVSDSEINSLSEERLRLQGQVNELEQTIEEISRSRDEARQSAVQEGAQYVQMIKMAGQLEERGREERKAWEGLKKEMEARIERLVVDAAKVQRQENQSRQQQRENDMLHKGESNTGDIIQVENTPPSSAEAAIVITTSSSDSNSNTDVLVAELRKEVQSLRDRCMEFEQTLLAVRSESHEIDVVIEALGKAGRRIREGVDKSLGDGTANNGGAVDATSNVDEVEKVATAASSPLSDAREGAIERETGQSGADLVTD